MISMPDLRSRYHRLVLPFFLPLVLVIFAASGFAGLIYESIWSHYLKLFLGHAAYAQTLVLAIFMGGMALGAWLASRWSAGWKDLLLAYAVIEALVGTASLVFHDVFVAATAFAFDSAIPSLGSPLAIHVFKWTLAAALILPQSVLLGMTFPLMTGGVLRIRPERSGYAIAMLYFANSLGAGVGVLVSGFYLIEAAGLPGTLAAAAVVNLAVAAGAMLLPRGAVAVPPPRAAQAAQSFPVPGRLLLLAVAALTGMSSFMYEIGWIRMLALVLGSSTHAFELMLSAFILGIAFGGLWIRRRIDAAGDTMRLLGIVQLVMGIAALATLPVYGASFYLMEEVMKTLASTDGGYVAFNVVSHGICLAVMFPAAFCAGMTLPLITVSLLRKGVGERAIGQVYGANTLGAIVGVLAAVHLGLPLLGLKGLIVAGAAIDLALGVVLIAVASGGWPRAYSVPVAAAVAVAAVAAALLGVQLDAQNMNSGVYRLGTLMNRDKEKVLIQIDGKTATVSVTSDGSDAALRTNGKSDGSIRIGEGEPIGDEATMSLMGALPQFLAPQARHVANIGFGTGMTAHVLLASRRVETVDTVEIEPAMIQASAAHLRRFAWRAHEDPRHRVHLEDAKTYFSSRPARFDVIVSEPSNPWVSGVASLFTTEFYRDARRYLKEDGLFLQWVQLYEMSPALLATVIAAIEENFADYELWLPNYADLVIVATNRGAVPELDAAAFDNEALRAELKRFSINNLDDLLLHRVGRRDAMGPYFAAFGAQANSDYFPILDLNAARARYLRARVNEISSLLDSPIPLMDVFGKSAPKIDPGRLAPDSPSWWPRGAWIRQAREVSTYLRTGRPGGLRTITPELVSELTVLRAALVECKVTIPSDALRLHLLSLTRYISGHLPPEERKAFWGGLRRSACDGQLREADRRWLRLHAAVAAGAGEEMARAAQAVLDAEPKLNGHLLAFAATASMAGLILADERGAAMRAYGKHRPRLERAVREQWQPVFRFLVGHADGGIVKAPGDEKRQAQTEMGTDRAPTAAKK